MKFKKIFVKLAILLAVCGLLVGSPQVYAAEPPMNAGLSNGGANSNENGSGDNGNTNNTDNSNKGVDQGLADDLKKIQQNIDDKGKRAAHQKRGQNPQHPAQKLQHALQIDQRPRKHKRQQQRAEDIACGFFI